jgi:pentose-5-phosphate-3-epimerase
MVKNVYMIVTEKLLLSCIHFVNVIIMWMMYVYQGKKKTQGIVTCHLMAQLPQVLWGMEYTNIKVKCKEY